MIEISSSVEKTDPAPAGSVFYGKTHTYQRLYKRITNNNSCNIIFLLYNNRANWIRTAFVLMNCCSKYLIYFIHAAFVWTCKYE